MLRMVELCGHRCSASRHALLFTVAGADRISRLSILRDYNVKQDRHVDFFATASKCSDELPIAFRSAIVVRSNDANAVGADLSGIGGRDSMLI